MRRAARNSAILVLALILLAPRVGLAKTSWTNVYLEEGQDNAVFALWAFDPDHAWGLAVRNNGQNSELIGLRTTNGTAWSTIPLPPASGMFPNMFTAIAFVDTQRGYLAGSTLEGLSATNHIWETTNGGTSWTEVATIDSAVEDFQVLTDGQIYGVGGDHFVHSADGQSWTSVAIAGPSADVQPAGVFMLNPTCGWIAGGWGYDAESHPTASDGAVWHTDDGGATWNLIAQGLAYQLERVHFVAGDLGFAVGTEGDRGVIARTTDGGVTWTKLTVPDHPALPDVCIVGACIDDPVPVSTVFRVRFWDAQRGIALGLACTSDDCDPTDSSTTYLTSFLRTYDGGATWTHDPDYEPAMPDINIVIDIPGEFAKKVSMSFPNPNHGYLGGQHNTILRYRADDPEELPGIEMPPCDSTAGDGDGGIDGNGDDGSSGCCSTGSDAPADSALLTLLVATCLLAGSRRARGRRSQNPQDRDHL